MKIRSHILHLITLLLCTLSVTVYAQKDLDSILTANRNAIYEDPDRAIEIGNDISNRATSTQTKVQAYMLISNAYLSKRENNKSMEFILKAQGLLKDIKNIRSRMNVLNSIGMQYQQLRIYDKAIDYLDESLSLSNQVKDPDSLYSILGYNHSIRGFVYREQMSCEIALTYFDRAIDQFGKAGNEKPILANISTLYYNKGNCFLQTSQIDSARNSFKLSISYAKRAEANSLLAFAKKGFSEVLTAEGNYKQAIQDLKEAEKQSENIGDLVLNQGIYRNLSENYLAEGNQKLHQTYFERYLAAQKEITSKERETINNSIQNLISENKESTHKKVKELRNFQLGIYLLTLLTTLILVFQVIKARKAYLHIKKELNSVKL